MPGTKKRFPGISVRSIIERYPHRQRQARWTDAQLIDLCKEAGLKTHAEIAKKMNRPRANAGSIVSVFQRRLGFRGSSIHGMSQYVARELVTPDCPFVRTAFWARRTSQKSYARRLYLWQDIGEHLKPDTPQFIRDAIRTLVAFEKWLWKSENPKREILKTIKSKLTTPLRGPS